MQYILDYDCSQSVKLEDIICRNFTVDVSEGTAGATREVELKTGGQQIEVNAGNREEFVRLFVEFEFLKQCE